MFEIPEIEWYDKRINDLSKLFNFKFSRICTYNLINFNIDENIRQIYNIHFYDERQYSWLYDEHNHRLTVLKNHIATPMHCFVVTPKIGNFLDLLNYDLSIYGGYVCFHGYIDHLIGKRFIAREEHDYELADYLRDEIKSFGMNIKDTKQGPSYWFNTNGTINITKKPIEYPNNVKVWSSFSMFINNTIMNS